jgi:hypothetical protein
MLIVTLFVSPCFNSVVRVGTLRVKVFSSCPMMGFLGVPLDAPGPPGVLLLSQPVKAKKATTNRLAHNLLIGVTLSKNAAATRPVRGRHGSIRTLFGIIGNGEGK